MDSRTRAGFTLALHCDVDNDESVLHDTRTFIFGVGLITVLRTATQKLTILVFVFN